MSIKEFVDKIPSHSQMLDFVESEAQRIVSEKKKVEASKD